MSSIISGTVEGYNDRLFEMVVLLTLFSHKEVVEDIVIVSVLPSGF